jgi:hydrogenase large subunit
MWRGIEIILQGRDPREAWIFTQRICGVCTTVHAIASVRAVENALGMEIPLNAQYIRNLLVIAHALHDHVVHFYHLSALDWVDVVSALKADPAATAKLAESLSPWPNNSTNQMTSVRDKLSTFVAGGQLGIFTNGYWGHPAMKLSPEVNLLAVSHYLQALDIQRKANQVVAMLGAKTPNIQNLAVGGVANAINLDNQSALNMEKLYWIKDLLTEVQNFIQYVYLPDVCAIGAMYPDWLGYGAGVTDYLAVPDLPLDTKGTQFDLPGGTIFDGKLESYKPISSFQDPYFRDSVEESIAHSYYDGDWKKHPWEEETVPKYTEFDPAAKYSWVKAPRFLGKPMQVGPLAQVLVGYASGHEPIKRWTDKALSVASSIAGVQLGPAVLHSTLGRHLARAVRAAVLAELGMKHWTLLAENLGRGDFKSFNPPVFPHKRKKKRG